MQDVLPAGSPYQLGALLGEGASSAVYEAVGPDGQVVALKILRGDLDARAVAQLEHEARLLGEIDHPGVVPLLGFGLFSDGRPYVVMKRLRGKTLAAALPLPLPRVLRLADELASALGALHGTGLLHRDLKPENVFITDDDQAVIFDLGIAREAFAGDSTITREGVVRGTPQVMAPERFFGAPASQASEVYELGVTLYLALTGQLPWSNPMDPEARLAPRPPPGAPPQVSHALLRALSTRPEARPPSPGALAAALRAPPAEPDRLTQALPQQAPAPASVPAPPRRRWLWPLVVGLPVLALAAVVIFMKAPAGVPPAPDAAPPEPDARPVTRIPPPRSPGQVRALPPGFVATMPGDATLRLAVAYDALMSSPGPARVLGNVTTTTSSVRRRIIEGCGFDLFGELDWFGIAFTEGQIDPAHSAGMISGRWTRDEAERCAEKLLPDIHLARDGELTHLERADGELWLAWPDDHTVILARGSKEEALARRKTFLAARGKSEAWGLLQTEGPPPLLTGPTFQPVIDAASTDTQVVPRGDGVRVTTTMTYADDARAFAASVKLKVLLEEQKKGSWEIFLDTATLRSSGKQVVLEVDVNAAKLQLLTQVFGQALAEILATRQL